MAAFVKFDPWASLKAETLADLATLAARHGNSENLDVDNSSVITIERPADKIQEYTRTPAKAAKAAKVDQGLFANALTALEARCPNYIDHGRWQRAVADGRAFLAQWGPQAAALGWTVNDLFGLHQPPESPHPNYSRLSRYDCTGLLWLLQGALVVALTDSTAAIQNRTTGNVLVYRKDHKPALGPLGDSLDDFTA